MRNLYKVVNLALPIIFGLIGQRLLEVSDAMMIGHIDNGVVPLAAAAFGGMLFALIVIVGFGVCIPVHVLVSQAQGTKQVNEKDLILHTNLWVALVYAGGLAALIYFSVDLLDYFGQNLAVSAAAKPYIQFLGWSLIPFLFFQCFKNYAEALHHPWTPFLISLSGILLNIFLNWIFIFGNLGVPSMGLKGAGLATLLSRWTMFFLLAGFLIHSNRYTVNLSVFRLLDRGNPFLKKIIKIGIPSASQILFELGIIIFSTIVAGWVGKTVLAAHNIAFSISTLLLMLPLGISSAITIIVGQAVGENDLKKAGKTIISAMVFILFISGLIALLLFPLKNSLPGLFVKEPHTASLAKDYLSVAIFLCFPYGLYIISLGSLRGLQDTKVPSIILFFTYFLIGPLAIYTFTFYLNLGGIGIWNGLIFSFSIGAVALLLRLYWHFKKDVSSLTERL